MIVLNKIRQLFVIMASFLIAALQTGCTQEEQIKTDGSTVRFHINTRTLEQADGVTINSMRFIVVDKLNSSIVYNQSTADGLTEETGTPSGQSSYVLNLQGGNYTVCAIANETGDMTAALKTASNMNDLKLVTVNGSFNETNVPYYQQKDFMLRIKSNGTTTQAEISTDEGTSWKEESLDMELLRTQCKVSLWLRKKTGSPDEVKITKVELCNYPDYSFLISKVYNSASLQSRDVFESEQGLSIGSDVADGNEELTSYTAIFNSGNIFPERCVTDKTDASKAVYLKIYAVYGASNTTYTVKLRNSLDVESYDLPRSTHYKIYGTIETIGEMQSLYLTPTWTVEEVPGDIVVPYLNVSDLSPCLTILKDKDGNLIPGSLDYDYFFWTNQPADKISFTEIKDIDNPSATNAITLQQTILRENTVNGIPDVAGKINLNMSNEELDDIFSLTEAKNYSFTLKTEKIDRTLNLTLKGDVLAWLGSPEPASGTATLTNAGTSNAAMTPVSFKISAFAHPKMVLSASVSGRYIFTTITKAETVNADNTIHGTYTIECKADSPRWVDAGQRTVTVTLKDTRTNTIVAQETFSLTITKQ